MPISVHLLCSSKCRLARDRISQLSCELSILVGVLSAWLCHALLPSKKHQALFFLASWKPDLVCPMGRLLTLLPRHYYIKRGKRLPILKHEHRSKIGHIKVIATSSPRKCSSKIEQMQSCWMRDRMLSSPHPDTLGPKNAVMLRMRDRMLSSPHPDTLGPKNAVMLHAWQNAIIAPPRHPRTQECSHVACVTECYHRPTQTP